MTAPKRLRFGAHLTRDELSQPAAQTYVGMAHFAGTGPGGKTCRECRHWAPASGLTKHSYGANRELKAHRCLKRSALMRAGLKDVPLVPSRAAACKYFKLSETPPPSRERL